MHVIIKPVRDNRALRSFVKFPNALYKGNKYYVPSIFFDEMDTLRSKNPAFEFSDVALFLAYSGGKVVGRVAAIINHRANSQWKHLEVRYGWFDFVDDMDVSKALLDAVIDFGKQHGMTSVSGPLGFTDFDPEGMLVDGYDQLCTFPLIYNYPYYKKHMEALGFEKVVDWLEYKLFIPQTVPEKIGRIADITEKKYGLKIRKVRRREVLFGDVGEKIFSLINQTYCYLYDFTILPEKMVKKYINTYILLLDLKMVTLVEDRDGNLIAFGVSMPSIVRAVQKCGGRMFPLGWYYILRSMFFKKEENLELLLVSVRPDYQNTGVLAMLFNDLIPVYNRYGFKYAETNAELESNIKIRAAWDCFDKVCHKRRRLYGKSI
ncbi:MAG: N-acetyltransferase [Bacteroidales bacterium]|jgi:GNAT superfamily N-acetyltransferase|nr:N-acetyltransferase [Bacteroidales bacterium]